ncbi:hypothetical protein LIER_05643 [Lithospermum erythrorhizon]|uniref:Reverse transcriptase RNase H-like domain-containing protein n=1 Tax=Lithospermum erythrorhizon TaxID=34254 RepID=A0AAV3P199_LITER
MKLPSSYKDIQKLTGILDALKLIHLQIWRTEPPIFQEFKESINKQLKPYFEAHPIVVVTDQPLKRILTNPALSGRMTTWAVELSEFDITYVPRTSIKAQVLADFVIECTARQPLRIDGPKERKNPLKYLKGWYMLMEREIIKVQAPEL